MLVPTATLVPNFSQSKTSTADCASSALSHWYCSSRDATWTYEKGPHPHASITPSTADASKAFVEELEVVTAQSSVQARAVLSFKFASDPRGCTQDTVMYWPGFVCNGTFFVKAPLMEIESSQSLGFKESVAVTLELAENVLNCSTVIVCLDKARADLSHLVRSFLFVGFELVHPSVFGVGDHLVLVGQSI
ncbi:acyl-CoA N-acyltransferase [Zopfochytrium polystomum]|nr:acyl-CoA N-acyltransferase [Zopfochytrium polystomum]